MPMPRYMLASPFGVGEARWVFGFAPGSDNAAKASSVPRIRNNHSRFPRFAQREPVGLTRAIDPYLTSNASAGSLVQASPQGRRRVHSAGRRLGTNVDRQEFISMIHGHRSRGPPPGEKTARPRATCRQSMPCRLPNRQNPGPTPGQRPSLRRRASERQQTSSRPRLPGRGAKRGPVAGGRTTAAQVRWVGDAEGKGNWIRTGSEVERGAAWQHVIPSAAWAAGRRKGRSARGGAGTHGLLGHAGKRLEGAVRRTGCTIPSHWNPINRAPPPALFLFGVGPVPASSAGLCLSLAAPHNQRPRIDASTPARGWCWKYSHRGRCDQPPPVHDQDGQLAPEADDDTSTANGLAERGCS